MGFVFNKAGQPINPATAEGQVANGGAILDTNGDRINPATLEGQGRIDTATNTLTIIDYPHHEIHNGNSYHVSKKVTAASLILCTKTPDTTKGGHFLITWSSESKAHMELIGGPTWTTNTGSQCPIFNRNFNSMNVSMMLEDTGGSFVASGNVVCNPTNFTGGTTVNEEWVWIDKKQDAGNHRSQNEWITSSNSTFGVKVTSDDGSKGLNIRMDWYEHTPY